MTDSQVYNIRFGLHNLDCGVFLGYRTDYPWKNNQNIFRYYSEEDIGIDKSPVIDFLELANNHPKLNDKREPIKQSFIITAEKILPFEDHMGYVKNHRPEILATYFFIKNEKGFYEVFDSEDYRNS